jgi:hypothetical protein
MDSMRAHLTAYQLTYWCAECGVSLNRVGVSIAGTGGRAGEKYLWLHSKSETFLRKSKCRYAGMKFRAPTIELEAVEG